MNSPKLLSETTFIVVDLETTGGSPFAGAVITEIGAVKVRGGVVQQEFKTFVNPLSPIPDFITELTGITDEMVRLSPIIDEVLPEFITFCGLEDEAVLVAHNAPFDIDFLKAAAKELEHPWPKYEVIDTARLARQLLTRDEVINCKLGTLATFFNTEVTPTHRALDDAQTTTEVMHRLFERLGSFGVENFEDLQKFSRKRIQRDSRLI